jgi:hypothetical protein
MDYIKARYPEQGAIWDRYMTDVQMVPARKTPRPEEVSTPKEAQAYLQSIQPKGVKVTSDMLAGERPRLKLEPAGEGLYRQTESGYIIPAGTTLTTGEGTPVGFRSLYYSSVIEPQFKGVREQTYGIPLEEQPAYKAASASERLRMRTEESASIKRAEKAYRGPLGGSGQPTGTVKSPSTQRRGGKSEVGFSVSSGISGGQGLMLSMPTIQEMSGAVYVKSRQAQMQALAEEEAYLLSSESTRIPQGLTRPSPAQNIAMRDAQVNIVTQEPASMGLAKESQSQALSLAQTQKSILGSLSASRQEQMAISKQAQQQQYATKQVSDLTRAERNAFATIQSPVQRTDLASKSAQELKQTQPQASTQITRQMVTQIQTPVIIPEIIPTRTTTPRLPTPPIIPWGIRPPSSGAYGGAKTRRRRKVELFSFELGEDSPVPTRYGLGGLTTAFVPGVKGFAEDILNPADYAPNRLFSMRRSR